MATSYRTLLIFLALAIAALLLRDVAVLVHTVGVEGADTALLSAQIASEFTL